MRVLSIQSSVVYGYVGNKSSLFPIQLHGIDVDPINSCQLSNHTGYTSFAGRKSNSGELRELINGLEQNNLLGNYTHVLTGYLANDDFAGQVLELIKKMKANNPQLIVYIDPVLGDSGKLYMPSSLIDVYKSVLQYSSVITPNQTEVELLTNIKINSLDDAYIACCYFHKVMNVPTVVITSINNIGDDNNIIHIVASTTTTSSSSNHHNQLPSQYTYLSVNKYPGYYSGTGDLMSALLLVWLSSGRSIQQSLEYTVSSIQAVIQRTYQCDSNELKLIQSRNDLEKPTIIVHCSNRDAPVLTSQHLSLLNNTQ